MNVRKLTSQKGITLVALIITIIVLLILAMVSIRLVMNGGIIDKSKNAVDKYSEEELQEQIKLAYSDWQLGQYTGETRTAAKYIQDSLNKTYGEGTVTNVTETEGVFTVTFSDGREYSYNISTGKTEKVAKWNDNGDGTWTHSITGNKIQIGDIVNYNELSNGEKSYTTDTSKGIGGSVGTKDSTTGKFPLNEKTYKTEDLTWRVLGVNESGQIELISENPTSEDVSLANEEGYLYGSEQLDKMCNDLYGNGTDAQSARSLKIDDVDKLAGITTDADKKACTSDYGKKWQYRYPTTTEVSGTRYMQYRQNNGNWTSISKSSYQKFRMPGENITLSSTNPGYSLEIVYTEYHYNIYGKIKKTTYDGKTIADLLCKGSSQNNIEQWLSNSYVGANKLMASFGIYYIGDYSALNRALYYSNEECFNYNRYIRPVVILKSNVKLSGNSEDGWTIQ